MELYGYGDKVIQDNLGQMMLPQIEELPSPHLLVGRIGNLLIVEVVTQQQSKLMGLYGFGVAPPLVLELIMLPPEVLQSPLLPVETIGSRFLVDINIQQQLKPMELYGLGVVIMKDNLELIIQTTEVLQSQHLPVEPIGSKFPANFVLVIQQQSKPMELYGLGVLIVPGNLGTILLHGEVLQSPHLPEEIIGNRLIVEETTQQQSNQVLM
jgi:hypothetical protein